MTDHRAYMSEEEQARHYAGDMDSIERDGTQLEDLMNGNP